MLGRLEDKAPEPGLAAEMSAVRQRIDELQHGAADADVRDTYLLDLQNMHEELRVADEEIRVQQEELDALLARQRSERWQHEQLLAVLPDAVLTTDSYGAIRMANAAMSRLVGTRVDKMLNKPFTMFVAAEDRGRLRSLISRVHEGQDGFHTELSLRHAGGSCFPAEVLGQASDNVGARVITWLLLAPPPAPGGDSDRRRPKLARAFSELSRVPLHSSSTREVLVQVATICATALGPGVGVSVSVGKPDSPAHVGCDGRHTQMLDGAQMESGEGPRFTAWGTGATVTSQDLRHDDRWPRLAERIESADVGSAMAVPVQCGRPDGGVLAVYAARDHQLGAAQEQIAQLMASTVAAILEEMDRRVELETLAAQLQEALQSRAVIDQAKGMIMLRERCDAEAAFGRLVELSSKSNLKLREVARHIVEVAAHG